jgi:hypothetical protein
MLDVIVTDDIAKINQSGAYLRRIAKAYFAKLNLEQDDFLPD